MLSENGTLTTRSIQDSRAAMKNYSLHICEIVTATVDECFCRRQCKQACLALGLDQ